jgi:hypothetical protein
MSWLVKGYGRGVMGSQEAEDRVIYTETAQYIADINKCIRDAAGLGSTEILVVKKGERGKGRGAYVRP